MTIGVISALALAQNLLPRCAEAQTISFTDKRIKARYVDYASLGGTPAGMRDYLMQPEGNSLNSYVGDVARRAATEGLLALAPDWPASAVEYPVNDNDGRGLNQTKLR